MHNQPLAIDSAQARCPTHPQLGDLSASQRGVDVVEAMNEGQLPLRGDVQLVYLVGEGAGKCCEGFLPGSTFILSPEVSQGPEVRSDIERNEVGCKEGHDAVDVLRVKRLHQVLYALPNEGFSHGLLLSRKGGTRGSPAALPNRVSVMAMSGLAVSARLAVLPDARRGRPPSVTDRWTGPSPVPAAMGHLSVVSEVRILHSPGPMRYASPGPGWGVSSS